MSIQFKLLAIFVVAAVIPIALVSLVSYHNSLKAVEEMVGNRTEDLAQSVGEDLARKLRLRLRDRILLTNQPVQNFLRVINSGRSQERLSALMELDAYSGQLSEEYSRYYKDLILVDASGSPVYRMGRTKDHDFGTPAPEEDGGAATTGTLIDSLSALIPQELPLPGQLRRQVEQFKSSIEAQIDRKTETIEEQGPDKDQVLPSDVVSAVIRAFSDPTPPAPEDPDFVGPQLPGAPRSQRLNIIRSIERYLTSGVFTEDEKLAARTAAHMGRDENIVYIHRSDSGEAESIRFLRPIFSVSGDEQLGAMIQDLRVDYLFPEDLQIRQFGSKGDLAIVDQNNEYILFHSRPELAGTKIRDANPVLANAVRSQVDAHETGHSWFRFEGEEAGRLASVFDVGIVGWSVIATSVPREFESEARGAGLINLLVATVALLLALGVLIFSSQRISASVHKVTVGARQIAAGNLNHTIQVDTHDEIETLADAFNSMTVALRENISLREKAADELAALNRTLEDRVQERTQELVSVNEALNRANRDLKELDRLKSNFLATVSHEFRTPLTSITAFSEILMDEVDESKASREVVRFLGIINTESERLGRLIKNLLDLSRIEAGRMRWDRDVFPVHDVLVAAMDGLLPVFTEKNIQVIRKVDCPDVLVSADRDRIQQVVTNLLENAIKFSPKGKRIWVGCREVEGATNGAPWLQATIRDEGPGIPGTHLQMIFERFSQVDSTDTRGTGGSGLGLAISREIVEHHGGRIWVESRSGAGAAFHFTLPIHTGPAGVAETEGAAKETEHA
jgi:signal transduction histidine kinase